VSYLRRFLDFLLYSNIFISICAAGMSVETYFLVRNEINWAYIAFVFCATLFLYNFPVFVGDGFSAGYSERHFWILGSKKPLAVLTAGALTATSIIAYHFPFKFLLSFIPITIPAFAYFFPQTHVRSVTGSKSFVVAIVWTGMTVVYPILLMSVVDFTQALTLENALIVTQNFFFMLPLCIIFNVRDIEYDRNKGVNSLPVRYGVKKTIVICMLSLAMFVAVAMTLPSLGLARAGLLFSAAITALLISKASENHSDYYYSLWIDGMILLQALLVILFNF
jgi:4-hydroxybenzoate polyprenyltransferase